MLSDGVGVAVGVGVAPACELALGVGVATGVASSPLRLTVTITITARIMASTRTMPKIICQRAFMDALPFAAGPFTVLGVPAGVLPDCCTLLVPQFGHLRLVALYSYPHRLQVTVGIRLIMWPPFHVIKRHFL